MVFHDHNYIFNNEGYQVCTLCGVCTSLQDMRSVDMKPDNISKLNDNKGFAVWIDKDILDSITRDIYEFLVFTRKDIKLAETFDGKISVVNCRNIGEKKWIIRRLIIIGHVAVSTCCSASKSDRIFK